MRIDRENKKLMSRLLKSNGTISFQDYQKSYNALHQGQSNLQMDKSVKARSIQSVLKRKKRIMESVSSSYLALPNLPNQSSLPDSMRMSIASG